MTKAKSIKLSSARNLSDYYYKNNQRKRKTYKIKDLDKIALRKIGKKRLDENIHRSKLRIKKKYSTRSR